jgi:hypothetical protein
MVPQASNNPVDAIIVKLDKHKYYNKQNHIKYFKSPNVSNEVCIRRQRSYIYVACIKSDQ